MYCDEKHLHVFELTKSIPFWHQLYQWWCWPQSSFDENAELPQSL